jgi:hypothetical protein
LNIVEIESKFLTQLEALLKHKVLNDQEFARAHEVGREEKDNPEARKREITNLQNKAKASESLIEKVPDTIKTFE